MAVDLSDYIDMLTNRVNPAGTDNFPDATSTTWLLALTNAFWDIRLHGMLATWEEDAASRGGPGAFGEGIITPVGQTDPTYDDDTGYDATTDIPRELVQFIMMWAAWKNAQTAFTELKAKFRAKAGDVEFEEQNAPGMLKDILDQLYTEIKQIIWNLSTYGAGTVAVYDSIIERDYSQAVGDVWWVR